MIPALAAVRCERRVRWCRPASLAPAPVVPAGTSALQSAVAVNWPWVEICPGPGAARGRRVVSAFSV